jgi:site-specific recombinase XerD
MDGAGSDVVGLAQWRVAPTLAWQEAWALWLHENNRAELTISAYLQDARHFGAWYERHNHQPFSPDLLTRTDVRQYFDWQKGVKAAVTSRNRRLASLRVLAEWAQGEGLLSCDPTDRMKRERFERTPRAKTEVEWQSILGAAEGGAHLKCQTANYAALGLRDRVVIELMGVGLRIAEAAGMDVDDFHGEEIHVRGKGGIERDVMISERLESDIRALIGSRTAGALICGWNEERLTTGQIRRRVKAIGAAAGIDLDPHDLRHTSVYRLLDWYLAQDVSLPTAVDAVRQAHGHSDSRTTMTYLRARKEQMREAARAL